MPAGRDARLWRRPEKQIKTLYMRRMAVYNEVLAGGPAGGPSARTLKNMDANRPRVGGSASDPLRADCTHTGRPVDHGSRVALVQDPDEPGDRLLLDRLRHAEL